MFMVHRLSFPNVKLSRKAGLANFVNLRRGAGFGPFEYFMSDGVSLRSW